MDPRDRAHDSARVVDLAAYRQKKLDDLTMETAQADLTAPGPNHPAYKALMEKEGKDQ